MAIFDLANAMLARDSSADITVPPLQVPRAVRMIALSQKRLSRVNGVENSGYELAALSAEMILTKNVFVPPHTNTDG
jgi:hypothetical protein